MKTVQDHLKAANADRLVNRYLAEYPIELLQIRNKRRSIAELFESAQKTLHDLLAYLISLEAVPADENIFYVVYAITTSSCSTLQVELSDRDEILKDELPEHYAWDLTDWEKVMGSLIADTKLTSDHIEMALVHILHEMTFLGFDHKKWKRRKAETERSLRKAEKEAERGVYLSSEEVFAKFHLPEDEPDEIADSLYRKVTLAQWEYNRHCRAHEAIKVRELLLKEQA